MRLGVVPFMNLKPMIGLYELKTPKNVVLRYAPPSQLFDFLQQGELDASFVSSIDYLKNRENLHLVHQYGVAAQGSVASVLLLCRKPLDEVNEILVDQRSHTSVAVLQVLLKHHFKLDIPLVEGDVNQQFQNEAIEGKGCEALLVIGDLALQSYEGYEKIYDLGEVWTGWTGLPFVFGVWVTREEQYLEPLTELLESGWHWTRKHWGDIIHAESERTGFDQNLVRAYLKEYIRYELTEDDFKGMEQFWNYYQSAGLCSSS